jgi:hypothetical protein
VNSEIDKVKNRESCNRVLRLGSRDVVVSLEEDGAPGGILRFLRAKASPKQPSVNLYNLRYLAT